MATGNCRLLVGCGDVPVKDTRGGNGMDEDIRAKEGRTLMLFGQEKRPGSVEPEYIFIFIFCFMGRWPTCD